MYCAGHTEPQIETVFFAEQSPKLDYFWSQRKENCFHAFEIEIVKKIEDPRIVPQKSCHINMTGTTYIYMFCSITYV